MPRSSPVSLVKVNEENSSELLKNLVLSGKDDEPLFLQALTHRSAGDFNNQRLEFLGDALLGFLVAEVLYEMFPEAPEGDMSLHRSALVQGTALADVAREHGIQGWLISGKSLSGGNLPLPDSALEDAVEALVAAFYLSKGIVETRKFVRQLFSSRLQKLDSQPAVKPNKTRLQEFLQAHKHPLPTYVASGEDRDAFHVRCEVNMNGRCYTAEGKGRKKGRAEAIAAGLVLQLLQESGQSET